MIEVAGDATRGADWAYVRLVVDGDRIVDADADGLDASLIGLTLLEAAAVPGERLVVDALANAIGPVFTASADPERIAVAMSGGVDSAVALLRAGPAAIGVTLRLWIDPDAPASERACCSPEAVIAARETCHRLGLPHVTLDAREAFRSAIVQPFVDAYARGETPNPCTRCNGSFRFAQLLAFARRAGAARLATGHYARIVEHRGRSLLARAVDPQKDQSYMLARLDPRHLDRIWFPLGRAVEGGDPRRGRACRPGRRAPRRESGGLLHRGRRLPRLPRAAWPAGPRGASRRRGPERPSGRHLGFWRFTPGQRRGLGVSTGEPTYAVGSDPVTNTVVVGPRGSLARRDVTASGRLFASITRGDAKLRYRSPAVAADVETTADGFRLRLDEPAFGVAAGQTAVLYEGDVVVGAGHITGSTP